MKKANILAGCIALVSAGTLSVAQAGIYAGIGAGVVELDPDVETGMSLENEGRDDGYKVVVGTRLGKSGGIELFYAPLGNATIVPGGEADYNGYGVNTVWDIWTAKSGANRPSIFVSLGVGALNVKVKGLEADRDDDWLKTAGIGARFPVGMGFSLRTTLEVFDNDASMASAMLIKEFGSGRAAGTVPKARVEAHDKPSSTMQQELPGLSIRAATAAVAAPVAAVVPVPEVKTEVAQAGLPQLENIYFNRDSALITEMAEDVLDELLKTMQTYPEMRVEVQGHTDGAESGNDRALSELRAQRVSNYLWQKGGIEPKRLSLMAYGTSQPAAGSGAGRLNRRVQFRVLSLK